jgi:hypothetical protein
LRIPLLIRYPSGEEKGARRPDPVSLADLTPTLADLHGLPASNEWIGTSLWRRRLPAEREIYATEDLDANRLYGLRRGPWKLVVRLYPTFSRTLFDLSRDPGEHAGVELACGESERGHQGLVRALSAWRQRDVAAFPSLRFDLGASGPACHAIVDVSGVTKPFLTAEDYCRWSDKIENGRLELRQAAAGSRAGRLQLSADDYGRHPAVRLDSPAASCSLAVLKARFLTGPVSEEYLAKLRALGYLGGPQ